MVRFRGQISKYLVDALTGDLGGRIGIENFQKSNFLPSLLAEIIPLLRTVEITVERLAGVTPSDMITLNQVFTTDC
jgi:hypothetical protein